MRNNSNGRKEMIQGDYGIIKHKESLRNMKIVFQWSVNVGLEVLNTIV